MLNSVTISLFVCISLSIILSTFSVQHTAETQLRLFITEFELEQKCFSKQIMLSQQMRVSYSTINFTTNGGDAC